MTRDVKIWIPVIVAIISGTFGLAEIRLQNSFDQEPNGAGEEARLPPFPTDAIGLDAELEIQSQDYETGDVLIEYTLILENITDETLEKVVLLDFITPTDVEMEDGYFEIYELGPGEVCLVVFRVLVREWGFDSEDQIYEVYFSIRIENENGYTEEDVFYYQIVL